MTHAPTLLDAQGLLDELGPVADEAEVFTARADVNQIQFAGSKVKGAVAKETSGVAVRLIEDGKLGFAGSRDTSPEAMARLKENARSALAVGEATELRLPDPRPAPVEAAALHAHDPATAALSVDDLLGLGQEIFARLRERHPDVVFEGSVRRAQGENQLRNSKGVATGDVYSVFSVGVEANRTRDEDVLIDFASVRGPSRAALDPLRVVEDLSRRLGWSAETVELKPGRLPVLFDPEGSVLLWQPLLSALNGKTVMVGTSPLRAKLGQTILDPRVTLTDDGLLPGALGSAPFDDEGVPHRTKPLIEAGVLRTFVHDLETATATGQEPTGNGERPGVLGRPGPGFSTLTVAPGEASWEELIRGVDYGLLVHSVMGMGQGNTLPGNFSNPVDVGWLIEGGEVKGRVKDVSIAGNVYDLLGPDHFGAVSDDPKDLGGARLPWVRIDDMNVVGKSTGAGA